MYLSFYNLKLKPFQMSTDPEFLWLGEKHKEALATLKYAVSENKGVLALTGDVGTGKTTLINALIKSLGGDVVAATIYDPRLETLDFFNIVADAFKIEETFEAKGRFIIHFMEFLIKAYERNQKVLLVIDEAQGISEELLEEIRLLSNLETEYTRLLNIFFVGQNEFVDILKGYKNRALRQRITLRYHIDPLTLKETEAYIRHRLKVSGAKTPIFDAGAIKEIFYFSDGYPRLINIICDHALLSGYVREIELINANVIRECGKELLISRRIPQKDFIPPENGKVAFKLVSAEGKPEGDSKHVNHRMTLITVSILLFVMIGTFVAGYFYYNRDEKTKQPLLLSQSQDTKYYSVNGDSKKNQQQMDPSGTGPSDIPAPVDAGKTDNSRLLTAASPDSESFKESVPKAAESFSVESTKEPAPEKANMTDAKAPDPNKKTPVVIPLPIKEENKIQMPASKPAPVGERPKIPEPVKEKAVEPIKTPKTARPETKPVQVQKPIPEEYPSVSDVQKKKEPEVPKSPLAAKEYPPAASPVEKKPTILGAPSSAGPPEQAVVSEAEKPAASDIIAAKEVAQPAKSPPEDKMSERQVDDRVVSSTTAMRKAETADKVSFADSDLQARLDAFLTEYCGTYAKKDLDKFSTFFASNAVEKGVPFRSRIPQYRKNFDKIDAMEYTIKLDRYAIQKEAGLVKIEGTFQIKAKFVGDKQLRKSTGQITMVLEADGSSFKVRELDY